MRVFHPGRFLDVDFCGVHTSRLSEEPEEEQKSGKAFIPEQSLTASAVLGFGSCCFMKKGICRNTNQAVGNVSGRTNSPNQENKTRRVGYREVELILIILLQGHMN